MKTIDTNNFDALAIKVASPEAIRSWSFGEVTKPETINYRTGRSERYGLFDERIFGPEKDYECYCGKYKRIRYKGIICEKCGVEVTKSIVRRERMGHIELASPVAHIWFLRTVPSRIALILAQPVSDVEKVVYFAGYVVKSVNQAAKEEILANLDSEFKAKVKSASDEKTQDKLRELLTATKKEIEEIKPWKIFDELTYHRYAMKYGTCFEAGIGAEAIFEIFKTIDLKSLEEQIVKQLEKAGALEREKAEKRLSLVRAFQNSGIRPEWMFMSVIPVIPAGIRPMVALEGGRYAASDVNDLYRRVINRNNRLKKLMEIGAPDVILRNEKRILQEACDALIDNSARHGQDAVMSQSQKRQLKSLSDNLKGKQGLLRGNLLGKRVDYSARSVIVVGPSLNLNECGLPKHMALELFKPFVISKLLERELAFNIRGANKLIEDGIPEVWAILEECIEGKYVLLNRAPTLHRLGIQAFNPRLIEGNAISLHPLVCQAFNADFDGDQMAVHLPLSVKAQEEARTLMAANRNLLKPGSGDSIVNPRMDMVLGAYWMTKEVPGEKGEGKYFASPNEAITAHDFDAVSFRAKIWVMANTDKEKYAKFEGKPFQTTIGRLLFNSVFPSDFPYINDEVTQKKLNAIIDEVILTYGLETAPKIIDKIKTFGYKYATVSGTTWGINAINVPEEKTGLVKSGWEQAGRVEADFQEGLLSEEERYERTIDVWQGVRKEIEKLMPHSFAVHGSVYDLITSGARGTVAQIIQMAGMKGIIVNNSGRNIDFPVISSYKEGLTPLEYFITTYGARKGNSDTALKTAQAGYLTRRLVDVAQDAIITEVDCGTRESKQIRKENALGIEVPISKTVRGRIIAEDISVDGKVLFKKNHLISKDDALAVEAAGITEVKVFSPLTCESLHGICQKCYGLDMGRNKKVDLGEAVGIVAAQAIGEPGTQLTMRTFHSGGVAGADITQGLPRVEEIFERRMPKNPAIIAHEAGEVVAIRDEGKEKVIVLIVDEPEVAKGNKKGKQGEYSVPFRRQPIVKIGDKVKKGQFLTDGSADIEELFTHAGKEVTEEYIVSEINKVYELQGAAITRKHVEVIIKQMFGRIKITNPGETRFTQSDVVEVSNFRHENMRTKDAAKTEAKGKHLVLGITDVALSTDSWLSSASFQNTTRVLITAATRGQVDELRGLKENVILGRLIPAGTGLREKEGK
ncbi:MAG: DNA-directed RNA polymerase subunit beta' [Candidatus Pacebacteria bacterium]|nr:DNA-directed RNA polymerase subunit beta' [Candidatus Paceibacterota bacterium]